MNGYELVTARATPMCVFAYYLQVIQAEQRIMEVLVLGVCQL